MKKLIIICTCFLLLGCSNKSVVINIYDNEKNTKETNSINEKVEDQTNKNFKLDEIKEKTKDSLETISEWYDNNKEKIKDINKEIIEEDKGNIKNLLDRVKKWYKENKDEIKETVEKEINDDKKIIQNFFNKIKKWITI